MAGLLEAPRPPGKPRGSVLPRSLSPHAQTAYDRADHDRPRHRDQLRRDRRGRWSTTRRRMLANVVLSQIEEHAPYGGVVPEIAARAHLEHLDGVVRRALAEAGVGFDELDGVAATAGPGLVGGVMVGLMFAKAIARCPRPAVRRRQPPGGPRADRAADRRTSPFPSCCCWSPAAIASCSASRASAATGAGHHHRRRGGRGLRQDRQDARPRLSRRPGARGRGAGRRPERFALPRPLLGRPDCDFSFSGLKTAVRRAVAGLPQPPAAAGRRRSRRRRPGRDRGLAGRPRQARHRPVPGRAPAGGAFVVAGGVAANQRLRARLPRRRRRRGLPFVAPPLASAPTTPP